MIEALHVWKWLSGKLVLRDVSLVVRPGERVVLVGPNGCGKSTLLQIIAGIIEPQDGTVRLDGMLGFAPEKPDLPDHLLVGEWLDLVLSLKKTTGAPAFGVAPLMKKSLKALSLGQKQRVSLAAAWLGAPDVLLLDEPTNALDRDTREDVITTLRAFTGTLLVATHDAEVAREVGTRVVEMRVTEPLPPTGKSGTSALPTETQST
jgi:ATPase subunit of ABC transporter with duplicated ATPase domains